MSEELVSKRKRLKAAERFNHVITHTLNVITSAVIGAADVPGALTVTGNISGADITATGAVSGGAAAFSSMNIGTTAAPRSATDTGVAGEFRFDGTYVYVCPATDTWIRGSFATW